MTSRREHIAALMHTTRLERLLTIRPLWDGLVVLNYHRIGEASVSNLDRGVFSGTADQLDHHIRLVRNHAEIIAPRDVPALLAQGGPRGRYVLFTFDDGYRDNYELAFPVLKSQGVQASFFLNSGFMDAPRLTWNDELSWMVRSSETPTLPASTWIPETLSLGPDGIDGVVVRVAQVYPTLREDPIATSAYFDEIATLTGSGRAPATLSQDLWMTWDMAREMHAAGMELGGHTVDHPALADVSPERQAAEIVGVRDRIAQEIGVAPKSFAYPYGGKHQFSNVTQQLITENGYAHAFSFYGGFNKPGATNMFDIRRLYMMSETTDRALRGLVTLPQLYGLVPPKLPWKR